jgi:hypothetical protein
MSFEKALINYIETVQETTNQYFAKNLTNLVPDLIQIEGGRKYVKIAHISDGGNGQKSVHSFIASENIPNKGIREGDILMPASWNAPAKHPRGNIYGKINLTNRGSIPYLR